MSLFDNLKKMIMFSITSTVFFASALIAYVAFNDYFLVKVYDIAISWQTAGLISAGTVISIDSITGLTSLIPSVLDKLWFFGYLFFMISIGKGVIQSKKEGYFSTIGALTYGTIILMFISGIVTGITTYVHDLLFSLIPSLSSTATLFGFYIANFGIINISLSLLFILMNFFDIRKLKQRKAEQVDIPTTQTTTDEI